MLSLLQRAVTLRQIRLLSALGKTLNLSQSAQLLRTTQPAASRALAQLEGLVQTRLFERTTKRIVPTPAGLAMVAHAERILSELALAEEALKDLQGGISAELRVGAMSAFSAHLLATAMRRASAMLPQVRLCVQTQDATDLYAALLDRRIDLMLAHAELTVDLNRVEVVLLYEEFSRIVAAPSHRLARRRRLTWADVANECWVLPPPYSPLRPKLDRMISVHRRPDTGHRADMQVDSAALALRLVGEGDMLWAIANQYALDFEQAGLVRCLVLPGELLRGPMCAFRLRDEAITAPTRVLLDCLKNESLRPNTQNHL